MTSYQQVPFDTYLYGTGYHYIDDNRVHALPFNLINALGAWDGQWYMRIAGSGYTTYAEVLTHQGQKFLDQYAFAFLPFYPVLVALVNVLIHNVLLSAFFLSNILLFADFFSIYYIVSKLYSEEIAMKTNFLLLFFPLSIFYRAYYAESLFLLLLLWFGYALIKRNWWFVGMTLTLLILTKPNGAFLFLPLFLVLFSEVRKKKIRLWKAIGFLCLPLLSYVYLFIISKMYMHNGLFWITAREYWGPKSGIIQTLSNNIQTIYHFPTLPFHVYQSSKTEIIAFFIGIFFFIKSRKLRYPELWYISLSLLFVPLLLKGFVSYARYEIVIFPLFIYLATKLKNVGYLTKLIIFFLLLLRISQIFINWGWVE